MTTTHTNIKLVENQIHIFSQDKQTMLFSTDDFYNKIGVEKLDRKHFVKPKVDVEELASNYAEREQRVLWENEHIVSEAFKAGFNAKEAEFTREEAIALFNEGCRQGTGNYPLMTFDRCVEILRPISLPKSVTLNENNEVISVEWT